MLLLLLLLHCILLVCPASSPNPSAPLPAGVIHVDWGAPGPVHDGSSWGQAYLALQDALAHPGLAPGDQIWVAAGTYRPDQGAGVVPGDRAASFNLVDGVELYGGFRGTESLLAERAGLFDATVLSGDIADANSFNVVTAVGVGPATILNGFRVTLGRADTSPMNVGGGLKLIDASPRVVHCAVVNNSADNGSSGSGGGVYSSGSFSLIGASFEDCTFENNYSGGAGGGVYHVADSGSGAPTWRRCVFRSNFTSNILGWGGNGGGASVLGPAVPVFVDCLFANNQAASYTLGGAALAGGNGGGLSCSAAGLRLENCVFRGNHSQLQSSFSLASGGEGGGLYCATDTGPQIVGCTFESNSAASISSTPGGDGILLDGAGTPALTNCILWSNSGASEWSQVNHGAGTIAPVVNTSCIQGWTGGLGGVGNLGADPLFADAELRLSQGSPCVDAGQNAAATVSQDLDGDPRFVDDPAVPDTGVGLAPVIDMGAYEYHDPAPLFADVASLSIAAGGTLNLFLDPGADHGGEVYFAVGSASGTQPQLTLAPGVVLPLNAFDPYFQVTVTQYNHGPLVDTLGLLGPDGGAQAALQLPPGLNLSPLTLHHAYVLFDPVSTWAVFASNPVALSLTP